VCVLYTDGRERKKKGKEILCGQTREQENSLFGNYGNLEKKLKKENSLFQPTHLSTAFYHN